jgi:multicomponent Na+:H+ antiporter subunit D
MVTGVLGALAQDDLQRMLSFHIVSHIGYMIFGLALFTLAGIAGAIFYVVHHIIVKTALFLVAGMIEYKAGSDRLSRVGGMIRSAPMIAVLFAFPALSIAGLPPFSGFVAKFALVDAGLAAEQWPIVVVSLLVSLLTMYVMGRIWSGVFWGDCEDPAVAARLESGRVRVPVLMTISTAVVVMMSLALMVFAGPLYDLAERAATDLLAPQTYVDAVLRGAGR